MTNVYDVLEVSINASPEVIKAAYKVLAMKYHPDRNPGKDTTEKFKEIEEAYSVLAKGRAPTQSGPFLTNKDLRERELLRKVRAAREADNCGLSLDEATEIYDALNSLNAWHIQKALQIIEKEIERLSKKQL